MQLEMGIKEEHLAEQVVAAVVTSPGYQSRALICRTFVRNGRLWLDCLPTVAREYIVELPADAMASLTGVPSIHYKIAIPHDSTAGIYLLWLETLLWRRRELKTNVAGVCRRSASQVRRSITIPCELANKHQPRSGRSSLLLPA